MCKIKKQLLLLVMQPQSPVFCLMCDFFSPYSASLAGIFPCSFMSESIKAESFGIFLWISHLEKLRFICSLAYRKPAQIHFRDFFSEVLLQISKNECEETFTADLTIRNNGECLSYSNHIIQSVVVIYSTSFFRKQGQRLVQSQGIVHSNNLKGKQSLVF